MLIRDILNLKGGAIYSIDGAQALSNAVALMVARDIGSLVVTKRDNMAGMLTFREVLQAVDRHGSIGDLRAADVMVTDLICGRPGDTLDELRDMMTRHHVRYLPVKDGEKLVGVVSFHDVARAVIKESCMENRLLRRYIECQGAEHP